MNEGMNTTMMVQPSGYGGGYNGGFGGFGGDILWFFLGALVSGGFGGLGGWGGGYGGDAMYPWINNGFQNQMLGTQLMGIQNSVTSGHGDLQTAICGVNAGVNNAQALLSQQMYTNEIASLNRSYDEQTANVQGFNGLQSALANCCCENRLATCQTQNIVQNEGAATRSAIQNVGQAILDKMCQDKIDAKNEKIVEQAARINALEANNYIQNAVTAQTQYLLDRLQPTTTTPATGA